MFGKAFGKTFRKSFRNILGESFGRLCPHVQDWEPVLDILYIVIHKNEVFNGLMNSCWFCY